MTTTAKSETPVSNHSRRKGIIEDLRSRIKTSKSLASDVEEALTALEKVISDDAGDLREVLDFIEDLVHHTPDAELRDKLLGIRSVIAAHPDASIEAISRLV